MAELEGGPRPGRDAWPGVYCPDPSEVDALITSAEGHALGLDFLRNGDLGSVAAAFGAHAFTVEAARERLRVRSS